MMTGSLKKKKNLKKLKDFFFFKFKKKGGGPLIRACSLIRSNTVLLPTQINILLPTQNKMNLIKLKLCSFLNKVLFLLI